MLMLDKEQFLALDKPVLYQKYHPCYIDGLCIKYDSIPYSWFYVDLIDALDCTSTADFIDQLLRAEADPENTHLSYNYERQSRDGLYDDEEKFLVYEVNDIRKLVSKLEEVLHGLEEK